MLDRFTGPDGKKNVIHALRAQACVQGNEEIASQLSGVATIRGVAKDEPLITQGESDNSIYFLIAGRVSIRVNEREVAIRTNGLHVGEMAAIDPSTTRSATVVALEYTVVAKVSESDFSAIAVKHPEIWRRIAVELCNRLRERNKFVRTPNPRPKLFIGCSTESLSIGQYIQLGLSHHDSINTLWTDNVFQGSHHPIEDLGSV